MFIVVEGNDASGKSSLIKRLSDYFKNKSLQTFITFEPGAGVKDDKIRKILLSDKNLSAPVELTFFIQSRFQNNKLIKNALQNDKIVISDRYHYSTAVYQGFISEYFPMRYGKYRTDLTMNKVLEINKWLFPGLVPDIIFFLLCPADLAIKRMKNKTTNFVDDFSLDYHKMIHRGYIKLYDFLSKNPESKNVKYYLINATKSEQTLFYQITEIISKYFCSEQ